MNAFVESLDAERHAAFDALGVSRTVVNVPLGDGWVGRLDGVRAVAGG